MEKVKFLERDINGKKNNILLQEGFVPAVVYNSKRESRNIMLDAAVARKIGREATSTTILDAELDDRSFKVVVKELDFNPVTDELRHIAFFEIDESKEMVFSIPFELVGVAPAVKNNLGIMVEVMSNLEVRCKVNDLIPSIKVDISGLEHPGQSIAVEDLEIPEHISLVNEDLKYATIVTITEIQEEEIIAPAAEEEDGEGEAAPAEGTEEEAGTEEKADTEEKAAE